MCNRDDCHFSGERLAELRKDRRWTQKMLADQLNVSVKTISALETEEHGPSIPLLIKLAIVFNISIDYLCELTDDLRSFDSTFFIPLPPNCTPEQRKESQELVDLITLKYRFNK